MASYLDKGTNNTSTGVNLVIPYPEGGISSGQFLLSFIYRDGDTLTGLGNSGGFEPFHTVHIDQGSTQFHWILGWKRATGAESGSVTWGWDQNSAFNEGFILRCNSIYLTGTPFLYAAGAQTNAASHEAASVDSPHTNALLLYLGVEGGYGGWSTIDGFTKHWDGGAGALGTVQSRQVTSLGATGAVASTTNAGGGQGLSLLLFDTTPTGGGGSSNGAAYNCYAQQ